MRVVNLRSRRGGTAFGQVKNVHYRAAVRKSRSRSGHRQLDGHCAYVGRTTSDISASENTSEDDNGMTSSPSSSTSSSSSHSSSTFNSDLETLLREDSSLVRSIGKDSSLLDVIAEPVDLEMKQQTEALRNVVGERHPLLLTAADHIFNAGGKRIRPLITLLVAKATRKLYGYEEVVSEQMRLSMVSEMIHTASLVHDDVLDDCDLRRGKGTVHSLYGTRVAVLAGDFLFAQSSWFLANLNNLEVIKLISQVIADFADGEIAQAASLFDTNITVESYLDKSFYKTASLIAASCRSAAVFSDCSESEKNSMFQYGRNLGLAFQVVDDILDFTQTAEELGKPPGQDLASGNLTAPTIFALSKSSELKQLLSEQRLQTTESRQQALHLVHSLGGIEDAKNLARHHGDLALQSLEILPESEEKKSLQVLVEYVLQRIS